MRRAALFLAVAFLLCWNVQAAAPDGWFTAGSSPQTYSVNIDDSVTYLGKPSVKLASITSNHLGFVTMMQSFLPDHYKGKRVRFSGFVKTDRVLGWAGLWMRVDAGYMTAAFDNMQSRAIKGTSEWTPYSVVLDVSQSATGINFGILLDGYGSVWLSGVTFEVVDETVPVTDVMNTPNEPANLGFQPKAAESVAEVV